MSALLHVEPLVDAAAELHIHPGIIGCFVLSVTALFNWAILSINSSLARQAAEREPKMMPRPAAPAAASAARSPQLARCAFLVLAALMSASWFVEPFAAAAEPWLTRTLAVIFILIFAALFNYSAHLSSAPPSSPAHSSPAPLRHRCMVPGSGRSPPVVSWEAVAVCLIGAGGSLIVCSRRLIAEWGY
ncbi:hypothetical protein EJB05_43226, partial [Eragrostis curvula]